MYQKFFSARSEKAASHAVVWWFVGTVVLETAIVALAVVGSSLFPTGEVHEHPRELLAYMALHGLTGTPWLSLLGAVMLGAIFAKVVSTANNFLFSPSTNLINDIFLRYLAPNASNKRTLIVSRLMVVLLGCWALYQSLHIESVLQKALYAYTIYSAALTPVILAAFYSKRVNAQGAVSAIFAGTITTICWDLPFVHNSLPAWLAERDAIFPALIAALVCLVAVSAFTKPPKAEQVAQFFPGVNYAKPKEEG